MKCLACEYEPTFQQTPLCASCFYEVTDGGDWLEVMNKIETKQAIIVADLTAKLDEALIYIDQLEEQRMNCTCDEMAMIAKYEATHGQQTQNPPPQL